MGLGYSFRSGSASGARRAQGPLGAVATAGFGLVGGAALGALTVAALAVTLYLGLGTFAACFALNLVSAAITGFLTIAGVSITQMCARGSAWMLGSAKGAVFDSKPAAPVAPRIPAPAPEAPAEVPRYAGVPPRNEFCQIAAPALKAVLKAPRYKGPKP